MIKINNKEDIDNLFDHIENELYENHYGHSEDSQDFRYYIVQKAFESYWRHSSESKNFSIKEIIDMMWES